MKTILLCLTIMLATVTTAICQATESLATQSATIHVYRPKAKIKGIALHPSIYSDGIEIKQISAGRFIVASLPPGKHMISAGRSEVGQLVDMEPGKLWHGFLGITKATELQFSVSESIETMKVSMAIHNEPAALSVEVIEEYLVTVGLCLQHRKPDGGCLGYPATLLLFCVVDALGGYLSLDKRNDIPKGEPFMVLNYPSFGLTLTTDQIKRLEWWYRNSLAHNAALPPGTCLTGEQGEPFEFAGNGDPVKIRVFPFHRLVERAWTAFDPSPSLASPMASSGCPLVPKVHEM